MRKIGIRFARGPRVLFVGGLLLAGGLFVQRLSDRLGSPKPVDIRKHGCDYARGTTSPDSYAMTTACARSRRPSLRST